MSSLTLPAQWLQSTLLVTLPAYLDESNANEIRGQLLAAVGQRPQALIANMSGTAWCDWAGAGVIASLSARALEARIEVRLVVRDETVRRVLSLNGLDRIMAIYRDVTTATYH
jgi:anti-anti-sigma factor